VKYRLALPLGAILAFAAPAAHADPTPWFSFGGGWGLEHNGGARLDNGAGAIDLAIGVGTAATHPFVVGGIFRTVGYTYLGTDISLAVRLAMRSFCVGDWGLALDLGVAARTWGLGNYGQYPIQPVLTGGMPFGFQVAIGADFADVANQRPTARGGFVALELDFLRLTAMRTGETTKLWPNPSPIGAPTGATP
jgi:hypothetical protein